MKNPIKYLIFTFLTLCFVLPGLLKAQQNPGQDKMKEKKATEKGMEKDNFSRTRYFSGPNLPDKLHLVNYSGNVTVEGYKGSQVIVEVTVNPSYIGKQTVNPFLLEKHLSIEQVSQTIEILVTENYGVDFNIKVPENTFLKIIQKDKGIVKASKTNQGVEINNKEGNIYLDDLKGWATVHNETGDIYASFDQVTQSKAMSFVTFKGDIYLNFPQDLQAEFRIKNPDGTFSNEFEDLETVFLKNQTGSSQISNIGNANAPINTQSKISTEEQKIKAEINARKEDALSNQDEIRNADLDKYGKEAQTNDVSKKITFRSNQTFTQKANRGQTAYFIFTYRGKIEIKKNK